MPQVPLFTITEPTELLALWRLVAEAKFSEAPDDADLWGSPFVHTLANRIADAMLESYRLKGDLQAAARHEEWLNSLSRNVALPVIKSHLKRDASTEAWRKRSLEEKIHYVRGCIAPFRANQDFLVGLVRAAEA